jgi:N6-L-threonylcarbamoyladenine synthase
MDANPDALHADIAASFVKTVMEVLMKKAQVALKRYPSQSFVIVGGVAASPQLREEAGKLCQKLNVELCLPPLRWSTDNAAMVALATFDYLNLGIDKQPVADLHITINDF